MKYQSIYLRWKSNWPTQARELLQVSFLFDSTTQQHVLLRYLHRLWWNTRRAPLAIFFKLLSREKKSQILIMLREVFLVCFNVSRGTLSFLRKVRILFYSTVPLIKVAKWRISIQIRLLNVKTNAYLFDVKFIKFTSIFSRKLSFDSTWNSLSRVNNSKLDDDYFWSLSLLYKSKNIWKISGMDGNYDFLSGRLCDLSDRKRKECEHKRV